VSHLDELAYRVFSQDGRWYWEIIGRSRRIAHGVEASPASARAQAFLFLLKFDYAQAAGK
jgi:hypothetical protein